MIRDDGRALSFGELAEQYDHWRPSYPEALVEDLLREPVAAVLDVGCGTGIAGRLFVARGCRVVGVEPDPRMAELAGRHGIDVHLSTFEEWSPTECFDLVISGQAWHWVDPVRGSDRAAEALRVGGRFAAFWNSYRHAPEIDALFTAIYQGVTPELLGSVALGRVRADDFAADDRDAVALASTGLFVNIERRAYDWSRTYSAEAWIQELGTHSDHRLLNPDTRDGLLALVRGGIEEVGGQIEVSMRTGLITAVRT